MNESDVRDAKTLSAMFLCRTRVSADKVAYEYEKDGTWIPVTFKEYGELVERAGLGLIALGLGPDERVAVCADTTAEWTILDLAAMAAGSATAGVYQTCTPKQSAYIINDSNASIVAVDSPERLEKMLSIRAETPQVKAYITWGGGEDETANIFSFDNLLERGRAYAEEHPGAYEASVASVTPEMTAILVYTSGTTGPPKGAMLTHKNCLVSCKGVGVATDLNASDTTISFLPMSHAAEHVVAFLSRLYTGGTAYFLPDMTRFAEVARNKKPTVLCSVPRLYEKVYAAIMEKRASAPPMKRALFDWAVKQGNAVSQCKFSGRPVPAGLAVRHKIADRMVLSKIREALGGKVRWLASGAAPTGIEIVEFFNAIGVTMIEVYGMTECAGVSHINSPADYKIGTVGKPIMGFECRVAEDGEILLHGDGVFKGYLNLPEATAEAIDAEGWLHTGDLGEVDADGFMRIVGRKKDLIVTAGGKNVSPSNIELLVKRDPIISNVLVVGDLHNYLVALITLSEEELEKLKQSSTFSGKTIHEIIASDAIAGRVDKAVQQANAELARYENIRKYKILERDFTIEDGEITPTQKLKRKVVEEAYAAEIDALYN